MQQEKVNVYVCQHSQQRFPEVAAQSRYAALQDTETAFCDGEMLVTWCTCKLRTPWELVLEEDILLAAA